MKTRPNRRNRGFTLIELLVVIAIIAVLAAAGFSAGAAALNKAKKVTAVGVATSLQQGIEQYYQEYSSFPDVGVADAEGQPIDTSKEDGIKLLNILLAKEEASGTIQNKKAINYLNVKEGKAKKNGIMYDAAGKAQGLYDPWGNPYLVVFDSDYNDELRFSYGGKQETLRGKRVAVYSAGADKKSGDTKSVTDDPKTW